MRSAGERNCMPKLRIPLPVNDEELALLTQWYFGAMLHLRTLSCSGKHGSFEVAENYDSYHGDHWLHSKCCCRGYDHSHDFWDAVLGKLNCGGTARASYGQFTTNGWRSSKRLARWIDSRNRGRTSNPRPVFVRLGRQRRGVEKSLIRGERLLSCCRADGEQAVSIPRSN